MASKDGMFLEEEERRKLIRDLQSRGELRTDNNPRPVYSSSPQQAGNDTGCLICMRDDDHNNLMLCEGCNDEYHTYCLDPPLDAVPQDDWFCPNCVARAFATSSAAAAASQPSYSNSNNRKQKDDGLSDQVNALPREFTSRFGEVCFANGGFGFGWWPSCIFDPRLTEGGARQTARKNLGKKHLVYFFECQEAPFAVLSTTKIVKWHEGLADNYHLGKTARSAGKNRARQFKHALQAAVIEENKPLQMRLDFHRSEEQPELLPLPKKKKPKEAVAAQMSPPGKKRSRGRSKDRRREERRHKRKEEHDNDGEGEDLYCKIMKRVGGKSSNKSYDNIGFVKVSTSSTYTDIRRAIHNDVVPDGMSAGTTYKFHVATLGPVSLKQESSLGAMLPFLRSGIGGNISNKGSIDDPIEVFIFEKVGDRR